jgi:hypothetical protein
MWHQNKFQFLSESFFGSTPINFLGFTGKEQHFFGSITIHSSYDSSTRCFTNELGVKHFAAMTSKIWPLSL